MKIRVGVLGAGFISSHKHLPALKRLQDADVVGLVDPNQSAAREVASKFGIPHVYPDLDALLSAQKIDAVDICTPPRTHAALAKRAIESGCHLMIEKPMAVSVDECDEIIEAAATKGVQVCIAHSDLFYPPFVKAREMVAAGRIGSFRGMRIFLSTATSYITAHEDHWANRLPGGVIGESGPHAVYMTLAFINPIREVMVHASNQTGHPWSPFDDYRVELIGDSGTSSVTLAYTSKQWAADVDIWGTDGLLKVDLQLMSLIEQVRPSQPRGTPTKKMLAVSGLKGSTALFRDVARTSGLALIGRYRNTHDILLEGFVRSIREDFPPPVTAQEGREAVRAMTMIVDQLEATQASS